MGAMLVEFDDLPTTFRAVAELVGLDVALLLSEKLGGEAVYIPKIESLRRAARDRAVRRGFDGSNYSDLARKHGLTVSWIRKIVHTKEM
jgi:Mor family transcriptional regulator